MSTYTVTDAPAMSSAHTFDCAECGHPELGRPVFLDVDGSLIAVGTGCAARLVGGTATLAALRFDAADEQTREAVTWLRMWGARRITAKTRRDLIARYGPRLDVEAVVDIHRGLAR